MRVAELREGLGGSGADDQKSATDVQRGSKRIWADNKKQEMTRQRRQDKGGKGRFRREREGRQCGKLIGGIIYLNSSSYFLPDSGARTRFVGKRGLPAFEIGRFASKNISAWA